MVFVLSYDELRLHLCDYIAQNAEGPNTKRVWNLDSYSHSCVVCLKPMHRAGFVLSGPFRWDTSHRIGVQPCSWFLCRAHVYIVALQLEFHEVLAGSSRVGLTVEWHVLGMHVYMEHSLSSRPGQGLLRYCTTARRRPLECVVHLANIMGLRCDCMCMLWAVVL